ncbi:response regulator, partial [bacterium]|nr:response regulator [bacterium]
GIAHDFNNILTPIIGYAELALLSLPTTNSIFENLEHILTGANRAKELVEQILLFSRQIEKERKPLSLHLLVKEVLKLLRPSIPATIEIQQHIDTSCEKVLADPAQIHQVIVNLCTNAFQAMEEKGGTLTIEMKQVEVDATTAKTYPNLEQKEYVKLSVCDTGIGIDDTTIEHIFEPFFTTKAIGKGTGLGLSVTYGILRSHHGDILVYSEPGLGSAFHVYLPITKSEGTVDDTENQTIPGGHESILIVDDEKAVTAMLKKMLEWLGYTVKVQNSGQEALNFFREHPDAFDLVLTDLTMPFMTGVDLAKELQQVRSELPIILMTGYGQSISKEILQNHGIEIILGKPIETKKIAAALRKMLDK